MPDLAISKETADELVDRTKVAILNDSEAILMQFEQRMDDLIKNSLAPQIDRIEKIGNGWLDRIERMIPKIAINSQEK